MKKSFLLLMILFLSSTCLLQAEEEDPYILADAGSGQYEIIEEYASYNEAQNAFSALAEEYADLVILYQEKVLKMEQGIVEFPVDDSCTYVLEYTRENGSEGRLNGCYAIDGLYLGTDRRAANVEFLLAGERGTVALEEVTLHPLEMLEVRTSAYLVADGVLYHEVKSQFSTDYYSAMIALGPAPAFLKEGETYYSYDGHWFYSDPALMSQDAQAEVYENAVNPEDPFYCYYQYLPHRSLSAYTPEEVDEYLHSGRSLDSRLTSFRDSNSDSLNDALNESQYIGQIGNFFAYEKIYGANALMMLALSINESGFGRSLQSYTRNNLFGHAAYDSDIERNASRYLSVRNSIYSHAKYYISHMYSYARSANYHGSFFGDKASGMNVEYSSDPYWGEKAAQYFYRLDTALGGRDKDRYAIGIVRANNRIRVYRDRYLNSAAYTLRDNDPMAFILLEAGDGYYKIQNDSTFSDNNFYDYAGNVAYIPASIVDTVLNPEQIGEQEYVSITFAADGGNYDGAETMTVSYPKGSLPVMVEPAKEGYLFSGYDQPLQPAEEELTYTAQYKEIRDFAVEDMNSEIEKGKLISLHGSRLHIYYQDGSEEYRDLTSDMIGSYDRETSGYQRLSITLAGITRKVDLLISEDLQNLRRDLDQKVREVKEKTDLGQKVSAEDLYYLKRSLGRIDYDLELDEIRLLDGLLMEEMRPHVEFFITDASGHDVGISGMGLTLPVSEADYDGKLLKNAYRMDVTAADAEAEARLQELARNNGYTPSFALQASFYRNGHPVSASLPFVLSLKVEDSDRIYAVFCCDEDGDLYLCRTVRSAHQIYFEAPGSGSYLAAYMNSENIYDLEDTEEVLTLRNSDPDSHAIFFERARWTSLILLDLLLFFLIWKQKDVQKKRCINYYRSLNR